MICTLLLLLPCVPIQTYSPQWREVEAVEVVPEPPILEALARSSQELRVYDIGSLVGRDRLDALVQEVQRGAGRLAGPVELERLQQVQYQLEYVNTTTESVASAIKTLLLPAFDEGLTELTILGSGKLVLVANDAQHEWLADFLQNASAFDGLVDIQVRIFSLSGGVPADLLSASTGFPSGEALVANGISHSGVLPERSLEALLRAIDMTDGDLVQAPRVLTQPFRRAALSVLDEIPYIADYELKSLPGHSEIILDPVMEIANNGIKVEMRCIPLSEGRVCLDAEFEVSTVPKPIPTKRVRIGTPEVEVTVQAPETSYFRLLGGGFKLSPGETLVITSYDPKIAKTVLILVNATLVEAEK